MLSLGRSRAGFFEPLKPKKQRNGSNGSLPKTAVARAYEEAMSSDLVSSFVLSNKDSKEAAEAEVGCEL